MKSQTIGRATITTGLIGIGLMIAALSAPTGNIAAALVLTGAVVYGLAAFLAGAYFISLAEEALADFDIDLRLLREDPR
ncbi:hypothetical protein ACFSBX_18940 [Halobellus rarus]|uniref:Uncharacterized protein n=1 Tax=Halobellus rarus TaxID=1126237 RepID=A0ABD6CTG7_9EURY